MFLKNISALYGKELKYLPSTNIKISNYIFKQIKQNSRPDSKDKVIDCDGLLLVPGFINSHTHVGDSIAKDLSLDRSVDQSIHPVFGIKSKILKNTEPSHLVSFMRNSCLTMLRRGITTFVDFREGGNGGINMLKKAMQNVPIRSVILGRLDYYQNLEEIRQNRPFPIKKKQELCKIIKNCNGLGVSGANENSLSVLDFYSRTRKLRAIHCAETDQSTKLSKKITGASETSRALKLRPHFLVHMTYASEKDLVLAAKKTRGIVICPRANAALAEGIPDLQKMLRAKCNIALGTDNVMINSPDIFREMDYLWKTTMGINKKSIDPKTILKMSTVNAGKMLKQKIGVIETGKFADCFFIDKKSLDLNPIHNPYAALVHRATESCIKAVMIGGKIVHGKI